MSAPWNLMTQGFEQISQLYVTEGEGPISERCDGMAVVRLDE